MNNEKLKLWIDALRSGEFEQGTGQLGKQEVDGTRKFCCLGVACEVAIRDGLELVADWRDTNSCNCGECEDSVPDTVYYDSEENHLPGSVQVWLGFNEPYMEVMVNDVIRGKLPRSVDNAVVSVIDLNDEAHLTFGEIADALEETFLKEESK